MEPMSFIEKVTTVFHLMCSNSISILTCVLVIALGVGFFYTKKLPKDKQKKIIGLVYGAILTFVLLRFASPILTLLNHVMQQLALVFYFPDIVMYILMFIGSNIILVRSLINEAIDSKKKGIHIIGFTCMLLLFVIIMKEIMTNHIDVYTITDWYQNQNMVATLQLSTFVFIAWMVVSGLYSLYQRLMKTQPVTVPVMKQAVEPNSEVDLLEKQPGTKTVEANPYFSGFEPLLKKKEKTAHLWMKKQPSMEKENKSQPVMQSITVEEPQPTINEDIPVKQPNEELLMQNIQAMIKGSDPKLTLEEYRRMRTMLVNNHH